MGRTTKAAQRRLCAGSRHETMLLQDDVLRFHVNRWTCVIRTN